MLGGLSVHKKVESLERNWTPNNIHGGVQLLRRRRTAFIFFFPTFSFFFLISEYKSQIRPRRSLSTNTPSQPLANSQSLVPQLPAALLMKVTRPETKKKKARKKRKKKKKMEMEN